MRSKFGGRPHHDGDLFTGRVHCGFLASWGRLLTVTARQARLHRPCRPRPEHWTSGTVIAHSNEPAYRRFVFLWVLSMPSGTGELHRSWCPSHAGPLTSWSCWL